MEIAGRREWKGSMTFQVEGNQAAGHVSDQAIIHYAHRSGLERYQKSPRSWHWQYNYQGIGVERARLDIPLARGIFVHRGLEKLLLGQSVDQAITFALEEFDKEVVGRGLEVASLEDSSYVYKEQRALIEGMLYGWWKKRLPVLLDQYEILEVEREEEWDLGEFDTAQGRCRLVWLGKADALLREKDSGDLFIQSFKTTADWDSRKDSAAMHDVQGLSELCAVEHRLEMWWKWIHTSGPGAAASALYEDERKLYDYLAACEQPPKIMGIRMEHLLAGQRREPKKGEGKVQYSHLIRGWKQAGITPDLDQYAWRYQWEDEHGATRRLGKGWVPFLAWEAEGGVRTWIDLMDTGMVQVELTNPLDEVFVFPMPYYRQEQDAIDFVQQMIATELRKFEGAQRIKQCKSEDELRFVLNCNFPQTRSACDYPQACSMTPICHEPGYAENVLTCGLYQKRTPHHEAEKLGLVKLS